MVLVPTSVRLLLLIAFITSMVAPLPGMPDRSASVARAAGADCTTNPTPGAASLTIVSAEGDCWSDTTGSGQAVLTYDHHGCWTVDSNGACTSGVWRDSGAMIDGAQWIWKTQQAAREEAGQPVRFTTRFTVPPEALWASGTIRVTSDNAQEVVFNGVSFGTDASLSSIDTYSVTPRIGENTLEIVVTNNVTGLPDQENPAGVTYRVDVSWTTTPSTGGSRVPWHGRDSFLLGINYPWGPSNHEGDGYGSDFGHPHWRTATVSTNTAAYDAELADMSSKGVHVVRWWMFTDGRAILTDNGRPNGVRGNVFADLDAALTLAAKHDLYLNLSLFDHLLTRPGTEGHPEWITDPAMREALMANVIVPVLEHIATSPNASRVMLIEVMSEPEWTIAGLPSSVPYLDPALVAVDRASFWDFAARITTEIHARTDAYATMGSAGLWWWTADLQNGQFEDRRIWTDAWARANGLPELHLDVYLVHHYPDKYTGGDTYNPLTRSYATLGLDKPLVIGEFAMNSSAQLDVLYANGYAGVWPWSYRGGEYTIPWGDFTSWETAHASVVDISSDRMPPAVDVTCPATAVLGSSVSATWVAADVGSGLATPASGSIALDTTSIGLKSVSASATDRAGNSATESCAYNVTYGVQLHYNTTTAYKRGATITIGLTLRDAAGVNASAATVPVIAVEIVDAKSAVVKTLNQPFAFTTTGTAGAGYAYSLNTKGLPAGAYTLVFTAVGDLVPHAAPFLLK